MVLKYGMPVLALAAVAFTVFSVVRMNPTQVRAEPASQPPSASYAQQVGAVGLIEPASENIAISVPVPGLVTRVAVKAGDRVRRGQILFSLDDRDLRAELALRKRSEELAGAKLARLERSPRPEEVPPLRARIAEAEAQLEDARIQLRLMEAVKDARAVRKEDLLRRRRAVESAEARLIQSRANLSLLEAGAWRPDLDVAKAELEQARAQVKRVEVDLGRLHVASPIDGLILQCKVRPGEYAASGTLPQPLILLGARGPMHIRADIDEKDAWRFRPGAAATGAVRGDAGRRYPLRFVRLEPYVIPKRDLTGDATERVDTRVLQVIYALPAGTALYAGQQMDLSIQVSPEGGL